MGVLMIVLTSECVEVMVHDSGSGKYLGSFLKCHMVNGMFKVSGRAQITSGQKGVGYNRLQMSANCLDTTSQIQLVVQDGSGIQVHDHSAE
jgi:hypothetical protein